MKTTELLAIVAAVILAISPTFAADPTTQPAGEAKPAAKAAPPPPADLTALGEEIEKAADPLDAIAAYARGYVIDPNSIVVHKAYMKRMLKARLPEMVYDSARVVATAEPDNAQAWTVLAHKHLRRGMLVQALAAIARAGKGLDSDPFAQELAGEILAAYDSRADKPAIPDSLTASLKKIRKDLAGKKAFAAGYARRAPPKSAVARPRRAREATAVDEHLVEVRTGQLADRIQTLSDGLDRQADSLGSSIRGSGGGSYVLGAGSGNYYLYESYGPTIYGGAVRTLSTRRGYGLSIRGGFSSGSSLYGTFRISSPYYYSYPSYTYGHAYRIRGSTTHGRPFRGIGGHSYRRRGGSHGAVTHGRPSRAGRRRRHR